MARLGDVDRAEGRIEAAEARYREALILGLPVRSRAAVDGSILGLACIAAVRNDAYGAGRLWGALEADERDFGRLTVSERLRAEETLAVVAERDDFERGRAASASLPFADALQAAISDA